MPEPILPTYEDDFVFAESKPFALESGGSLQPVTLRYAVYGNLNEARDNAILVCHALSGSARAGDWWPQLFGEDGVFDLSRDCIICANIIGSCYGSTGPQTINSATGKPFGANFPLVTVRDWVRSQSLLLDHLGVEKLRAVIGGSIGGMQAIQWAIDYPERVENCIAIGSAPLTAMGLALNHLQRLAITNDANWRNGEYESGGEPMAGLALARAIAMISYKSEHLFAERFARNPNRNGEDPLRSLNERYDIGGYLDHQGEIFTRRFDANSYLIISKAMDNFHHANGRQLEHETLRRIKARVLLVGISSDWLFPAEEVKALAERMREAGVEVEYAELQSSHGHDGFLAEPQALALIIRSTLPANHFVDPDRRKR
ncbi:MAG: Homoserine O-acetyltransferase [Acidobacteria bacterium]|nr:Homoserine O-acetyltransferase [Acidobacteriota bacterium]